MSSSPPKNSTLSLSDITPEQDAAIDALYEKNTLLIARKGFGKAVVGLTAVQALQDARIVRKVLIVAPLKVCQLTWANEWKKWEHLRPVSLALGDQQARLRAIYEGFPVVVINIENLAWLFETLGTAHGFDGLLIDELSKFKAAGGKTLRVLRKHLKDFKWRSGMSASPVAEAGVDIYAQALIIDEGKALGRNKDAFMRAYFYPTDFMQYNWALMPGAAERLAAALKDLVFVADDMGYEAGLPELRDAIVQVEMPAWGWRAYKEMCEEMTVGELSVEAPNAAVVSGKLRQITAGAVYDDMKVPRWIHWAKFDALEQVIAAAEGPLAIGYEFKFELDELKSRWPEIVVLGEDAVAAEDAWTRGEIRLLAVHPKSASHGLNLQYGGHELVVLTPPWGADPWEQLVGRFRRRGQRSKYVRRTTLVVSGSIDELVMDRLLNKAEDESSLMAHITDVAQK